MIGRVLWFLGALVGSVTVLAGPAWPEMYEPATIVIGVLLVLGDALRGESP